MEYIKLLQETDRSELLMTGGKGANLGELMRAGLPVPAGFVVLTDGYQAFVADNNLNTLIRQILAYTQFDDPSSLQSTSDEIIACFKSGKVSSGLAGEIFSAYRKLSLIGGQPCEVAVRSSATAEDLPDLSFAGQQDTYLNVCGEAALLEAVIDCWASLWTARAIGYRAHNAISQSDISLAVVIQQMVQSQVSGVLFTANPLSGKRRETVVDAVFGLGESLVSGQVEPDHYLVDSNSGEILARILGEKSLSIQGQPGGGAKTVRQDRSQVQALPDEQIIELVRLGRLAEEHFGSPQDMEWAWHEGHIYVVQSRPITSLYPLPANLPSEPLEALLSFGVWQGMLDPYTPLGQDFFFCLISSMGRLLGASMEPDHQQVMYPAGERLFIKISPLLRNSLGRKIIRLFILAVDAVSGGIIDELCDDKRFAVAGGVNLKSSLNIIHGFLPFGKNILKNLAFPERVRPRLQKLIEKTNAGLVEQCMSAQSLSQLIDVILPSTVDMIEDIMPPLVAAVASGQGITRQILSRLADRVPQGPDYLMEMSRGLPDNVTTEMDLALWQTAQALKASSDIVHIISGNGSEVLAARYHSGKLPPTAQRAIAGFLEKYGMRGVAEIDIGRSRWNEDAAPVFQVLKSYMDIDEAQSPEAVFRRSVESAQLAAQNLAMSFSNRLQRKLAVLVADRFRQLGGLREFPKFGIIQWMGIYRGALLAQGEKAVKQGLLAQADDVFFLRFSELRQLESSHHDWQKLVEKRRAVYRRELRRRRVPRILLSDGTAYYETSRRENDGADNILTGSPVSAGVVEGIVHVIVDPHRAYLHPGEIMVCPATDPAWTPLFLAAEGLIMEVGGMVSHGSVVAREYGIPAVVGVLNATQILKDGQRIRLNGSTGQVILLDRLEESSIPY